MPLIAPSRYQPPTKLWNGHLQTIIPSLFRKVAVSYVRERIETPDDDFLDLDWAFSANREQPTGSSEQLAANSEQLAVNSQQLTVSSQQPAVNSSPTAPTNPTSQPPTNTDDSSLLAAHCSLLAARCSLIADNCTLVILSHGLEGSSTSPYLAGMVKHLTQHGFDCLAWHFRSCSGELNRQQRFYHIGETGDLHFICQYALSKGYKTIYLMGFSAGGNVTLKYLGERGIAGNEALNPAIKKAVVFSVPLDLMGSARRLEQWDSLVYNYRFNRTLKRKVLQKAAVMPGAFPTQDVTKARNIREFDNLFTAPQNGFRDVTDYYTRSSSLQFIPNIPIPTLIVNAKNDPFLSPECFPEELARELTNVWMEFPEQGGHCGFPPKTGGINSTAYWSEKRTVEFLTNQ